MKEPLTRLREQFEENPSLVMGAAAAALMGTAKLIDAVSNARSRNAYAKDVNRRLKKSKK